MEADRLLIHCTPELNESRIADAVSPTLKPSPGPFVDYFTTYINNYQQPTIIITIISNIIHPGFTVNVDNIWLTIGAGEINTLRCRHFRVHSRIYSLRMRRAYGPPSLELFTYIKLYWNQNGIKIKQFSAEIEFNSVLNTEQLS